jgi:DNA-binding CsgD family transcriptional regulator
MNATRLFSRRRNARDHRQRIYARHGLMERVSLVCPETDGGVLAINLYRGDSQPSFDDDDMDTFRAWGAPLLATMQLHIRLTATINAAKQTAPAASCLQALPRREREVCDRLLRGWTYDGIAADLAISPGTVKTYRDRAFDRLGLHHRNELFALALREVTN